MGNAAAVAKAFARLHQGVAIPYYEKLLDQGYSRLIERGHTVFDVGAHSGLHLDRFVALVGAQGRVFAFEPIPRFAKHLAARYRKNSVVTVKPVALSDSAGSATFKVVEGALEQSGLKLRDEGAARRSAGWIGALAARLANGALQRTGLHRHIKERPVVVREIVVDVDTIDAQAASLQRLDYIKLDVEGAEMNCLRGAQAAVSRCRPFISVEYGRASYSIYGHSALSLFEWSRQNRYLLSDLFGNIVEDESEWLEVCDVSYWDFFLLPQERRDFWSSKFQS
jgi:FkbM family methyltransferase